MWSDNRSPLAKIDLVMAEALVYLTAACRKIVALQDIRFFRSCGTLKNRRPSQTICKMSRRDLFIANEEQEFARLARTIAGITPTDFEDRTYLDLRLTNMEKRVVDDVLEPSHGRRFVAVNMCGKSAGNDWEVSSWQTLMAELHRINDLRLVFVSAESDTGCDTIVAAQNPREPVDLCGKLNPRETAAVWTRASLVAGHDSGPPCNVRCAGICRNQQKPGKWHPYGIWHRIFHPSAPISSAPLDLVPDAVLGTLSKESSPCQR
jgi:heptosyltransferase III